MKNYHLAPRCPHCLGDALLLSLTVNPPIEMFECANPACPHYGQHRPVEEAFPPENYNLPPAWLGKPVTETERAMFDRQRRLNAKIGFNDRNQAMNHSDPIVGANSIDLTASIEFVHLQRRQSAEASFAAEQPPVWRGVFVLLVVLALVAIAYWLFSN